MSKYAQISPEEWQRFHYEQKELTEEVHLARLKERQPFLFWAEDYSWEKSSQFGDSLFQKVGNLGPKLQEHAEEIHESFYESGGVEITHPWVVAAIATVALLIFVAIVL